MTQHDSRRDFLKKAGIAGAGVTAAAWAAPSITSIDAAAAATFSPLTGITWLSAYWASDPSWSNPGNGNPVSSWRDGSGNSRPMTNATGGTQPVYLSSGINGQPVVNFDGSNDVLTQTPGLTRSQAWTIFAIFQILSAPTQYGTVLDSSGGTAGNPNRSQIAANLNNSGEPRGLYGYADGGIPAVVLDSGATSTNASAVRYYGNGTSSAFQVNNRTLITNTSAGTDAIDTLIFGRANPLAPPSAFVNVSIAFVGVYAGDLTAAAGWASFKSWVSTTYGLTVGS